MSFTEWLNAWRRKVLAEAIPAPKKPLCCEKCREPIHRGSSYKPYRITSVIHHDCETK